MPKEKSLILSTHDVQAILAGRKTQARIALNPQPYIDKSGNFCWGKRCFGQHLDGRPHIETLTSPYPMSDTKKILCPYGKPGDQIYVRETCTYAAICDENEDLISNARYYYEADTDWRSEEWDHPEKDGPQSAPLWTPSCRMPKAAARLWLEVVSVKCERLQSISEEDAKAEGASKMHLDDLGQTWMTHKRGFESQYVARHGQDEWDANKWQWAVTFKVLSTTGKPHGNM